MINSKLINIKKKIIKAYIIGKHKNFFIKQINKKIKFETFNSLNTAVYRLFRSFDKKQKLTILFSPASASYDQFKNFGKI